MKNVIQSSASFNGVQNLPSRLLPFSIPKRLFAVAALLVLTAGSAQAANILVNPSFESPPHGHVYPTNPPVAFGWTRFAPPTAQSFGNYWVDNAVTAHTGTYYWKEWGACYNGTNNVAGIYQTLSSSPGSTYQASGWLYVNSGDQLGADCFTWLQVEFLDSTSNLLALYKSQNFNASVGLDTWFQYSITNACDITQPVSLGDPFFNTYAITGAVSQLVAPASTALVRFRYCYTQVGTEGGSSYVDDVDLEQLTGPIPPVISSLYPQNMILVPPSSGLSFNVNSPSSHVISTNSVHVALNGVDVSKSLTITGNTSNNTSTNLNVVYSGLQSNLAYNVSITVTDSFGFTASVNTHFETTWLGVQPPTYLWEAEDWDFTMNSTNGLFYDNPTLCNAPGGINCYFGVVGTQGIDEFTSVFQVGANYHVYRPDDLEGTALSEDYTRPNLFAAGREDYCINPFNFTDWVNYTRDWPNSTNWIIGRFANGSGTAGGCTLSLVTPTTTNVLGTFNVNPGASWSDFQYVYLSNTNGNGQNANVVLNGKETLQLSATLPSGGGNALPTFFMLVPAQVDLPFLSGLYPTGKQPFQFTNTLSFTVTTLGATFPANGVQVILDGNNVSAGLVITGSSSSNNVVYPHLAPNEMHIVIINVTNSLGHGISVTNKFDTFSLNNYMFEAEDYDYDAGQYVPSVDYFPGAYTSFTSVTNVDFHHTLVPGEPTDGSDFPYRINGIPQGAEVGDYYRAAFFPNPDYQLIYYGGGDWVNYTRDFPPGAYYIYVRTSGLGPYTMTLGQVSSGQGTSNQVVHPLGQWSAVGTTINSFAWVPLTDGGGVAPSVVNLTGVPTLQVGTPTGNCYPNYFMLVPATPISLRATLATNQMNLSFPTQNGGNYRIFYRTNLTVGYWTLLTSVLGDGTVKSATDSTIGDNQRFYKVTSP
jgi:hypothetical protein